MEQMTVQKLFSELSSLMLEGRGNDKIIIADDNEGNGYHGCFYSCTSDPKEVKANIEASNGLYDSQETDYKHIVIVG